MLTFELEHFAHSNFDSCLQSRISRQAMKLDGKEGNKISKLTITCYTKSESKFRRAVPVICQSREIVIGSRGDSPVGSYIEHLPDGIHSGE